MMCMDFTNLNKACPKDNLSLPRIDALVDFTSGYELLSFMNAFSGYNQIIMHSEGREKTAFIIDRGFYYYKVIPFSLKNKGATYQRLVNKMFQALIRRNMEVDRTKNKYSPITRIVCNKVVVQVRVSNP
jgi:hypothetical protein